MARVLVDEAVGVKRVEAYIDPETLQRAVNTVNALSGPPYYLNFSRLARRALRAEIRYFERRRNGGKRFPNRGGNLHPRPPGMKGK